MTRTAPARAASVRANISLVHVKSSAAQMAGPCYVIALLAFRAVVTCCALFAGANGTEVFFPDRFGGFVDDD